MLPKNDALQFEAGYRFGYSEAKEEDEKERLRSLGEAAVPDVPLEEVPEPSHVMEEGTTLPNPPAGSVIDIPQSPPLP